MTFDDDVSMMMKAGDQGGLPPCGKPGIIECRGGER